MPADQRIFDSAACGIYRTPADILGDPLTVTFSFFDKQHLQAQLTNQPESPFFRRVGINRYNAVLETLKQSFSKQKA